MTLDAAWLAIDRALEQAIARRERIVLLITGHQRCGEPPIQRGASARPSTTGWRHRGIPAQSPQSDAPIGGTAAAEACTSS